MFSWAIGCGDDDARPSRQPVARPIPKIDVHTHVAIPSAEHAVALMRAQGIAMALNASGGEPGSPVFGRSIAMAERTNKALVPYCNIDFRRALDPDAAAYFRALARDCRRLGGVGLKIPKVLGLGLIDEAGELVPVDDPRLDPLFEEAGAQHLPILIHTGDPQAFFRPPTHENERYEELAAHPDWSFYGIRPDGGTWPSWEALYGQFERRVARHPQTTFVGAHFGNAPEDPDLIERMLATYPNLVVETGARIPEIGRHDPGRMRRLFDTYQDRILFGTDLAVSPMGLTLGSSGAEPDTEDRVPFFFGAHWRYFETRDRGFAHPTPIQGRWTIDGIGLPRNILEKIYWKNAARVFDLALPREDVR